MNSPSDLSPVTSEAAIVPTLERMGLSVFLFGAVFLLMTIGMTSLLQPDRFPVHVGGKVVRVSELSAEEQRLKEEQNALIMTRDQLLKSQDTAPVLTEVQKRREAMLPIGAVLLHIDSLRSSFATTSLDPIALPGVRYDGALRTLFLSGHVTDPAGGSNHILASFVDGLRTLPDVAAVSEPEYVQTQSTSGLQTPFTITIRFSEDA